MMVTKETTEVNELDLMKAFPEADIILLEGLKHSSYPKYFCNYPEQEPISAEELAEEIIKQMQSFC
jgi:molybdopterin-guanine dinucleotide biosynthesis protein